MYLAQAALNNLLFSILESQGHGDRVTKNPVTVTINLKKTATVLQLHNVAMQIHYFCYSVSITISLLLGLAHLLKEWHQLVKLCHVMDLFVIQQNPLEKNVIRNKTIFMSGVWGEEILQSHCHFILTSNLRNSWSFCSFGSGCLFALFQVIVCQSLTTCGGKKIVKQTRD